MLIVHGADSPARINLVPSDVMLILLFGYVRQHYARVPPKRWGLRNFSNECPIPITVCHRLTFPM